MNRDTCYTAEGVRIPVCWRAVIYGDEHCTCHETRQRRRKNVKHCDAIEELLVAMNTGRRVTRDDLDNAVKAVREVRAELEQMNRD